MIPVLKVLIVEDDPNVRLGCEQAMQLADIAVEAVASAEDAMRRIGPDFPGVVVTDMRLPQADGLALLNFAIAQETALPVIMITGHGGVSLAVEAMRSGAYDFIEKPFSPEHLVEVVRRALEKRALTLEVADLRRKLERREATNTVLIGRSPQMVKVRQLVAGVSAPPPPPRPSTC
jgi:DNA-binding NtrC family response regulator